MSSLIEPKQLPIEPIQLQFRPTWSLVVVTTDAWYAKECLLFQSNIIELLLWSPFSDSNTRFVHNSLEQENMSSKCIKNKN